MDFGFVRGTDFNYKTETGRTITSIDGKSAYLAVIDRASRYTWIFITESKQPPVEIVRQLLEKFKSTNPHRTVRVDQGGELGKSAAFRTMIGTTGFLREITGSDASTQNGMVENPNRMFGQMMRCMLHSAELGPEYWSYALLHAVYIKNRLPHHTINKSPFEAFTGNTPDLSNLRIFGSRLYARKPGRRPFKLDHHTSSGYFLGFTATGKNVQYIDEKSGRIKTSTHVIFDEAHMATSAKNAPMAAQTLQRLGYYAREEWIDEVIKSDTTLNKKLLIQQLSHTSVIPTRSTELSIGYDLYFDGDDDIVLSEGQL